MPISSNTENGTLFYFISGVVINEFLTSLRDETGDFNILVYENFPCPVSCNNVI